MSVEWYCKSNSQCRLCHRVQLQPESVLLHSMITTRTPQARHLPWLFLMLQQGGLLTSFGAIHSMSPVRHQHGPESAHGDGRSCDYYENADGEPAGPGSNWDLHDLASQSESLRPP